ncbi:unnamed protein product [Ranitomeya imitator]|uniref:SUI1 domain-containing protein n=8 Tax=Tetrapoda TaxID=32523 RepID=A0ABN9L6W5_9NEOB|nr:unnamed protein product [Ranitomeya imitator]
MEGPSPVASLEAEPAACSAEDRTAEGYISVIKMHFGTNLPAGRFGGAHTRMRPPFCKMAAPRGEDGRTDTGRRSRLSVSALTVQAEGAAHTVIAPSDLQSEPEDGKMERRPACGTRTDPFADATKGDDLLPAGTEDYIHIRIQQRNGRKTLTTVQGIADDYDKKKLVKAFKKKFACNGTVIEHPEYGEVIQLQGDQRKNICQFLMEIGIVKEEQLKVHGF